MRSSILHRPAPGRDSNLLPGKADYLRAKLLMQESLLPTLHLKISISWRRCSYQHASNDCCGAAYLLGRRSKSHFTEAETLCMLSSEKKSLDISPAIAARLLIFWTGSCSIYSLS